VVDGELVGARLGFASRVGLLAAGVAGVGAAVAVMLAARLGVGPIDVFLGSVSARTGVDHGLVGFGFAAVQVVAAVLLGCRVRPGTVFAALAVGPTITLTGFMLSVLAPTGFGVWAPAVWLVALGVLFVGVAAILHADFGPGAFELVCLRLAALSGLTFARLRLLAEVGFAVVGLVSGGPFTAATVVVAVTTGHGITAAVVVVGRLLAGAVRPTVDTPRLVDVTGRFDRY
jgi:uncharacterized membrane protein YczE